MQPQRQIAPRLQAILFADDGKVDDTGKASIAGLFDRIYAKAGNAVKFIVFIRAVGLTHPCPLYITVTAPNGKQVGSLSIAVHPKAAPFAVQNLAPIQLPVVDEGVYRFDVKYDRQLLGVGELTIGQAWH